jgi:hypothetical protein
MENVKPYSEVHTDDFASYDDLGDIHGYWHKRVRHSDSQYVAKGYITTNGIEGFWAQL